MAGKKVSKNSRTVSVGGSKFQISADVSLITPLNHGKHAYLTHPKDGRNLHRAVNSAEFDAVVAEIVALGYGDRLRSDLIQLSQRLPQDGWDVTLSRLDAAGAFTAAEVE